MSEGEVRMMQYVGYCVRPVVGGIPMDMVPTASISRCAADLVLSS